MTSGAAVEGDMNWCAVLDHHASRTPDKPITIFEGATTTYGEMAASVAMVAAGLNDAGVGPGDVVGLLSYNCPEFLETIFAANYLGAIAMPINWRLAPPEVRYILEHAGARVLVCDEALVDLADRATDDRTTALFRACISPGPPDGWVSFAELHNVAGPVARVPAAADDIHRLMYTSGTTGRPKGVMITHANLAWKNLAHIVEFGFTGDDLGLACGPLYHVGALDLTTTSLIAAGATIIIQRSFVATDVVDELERSRVRTVWLAPAMVNAIMTLPDIEQRDLSSVRVVINGGEKMPIPLIERLHASFRRRGSPTPTVSPRLCPVTRFWTGTACSASSAAWAVRVSIWISISGTNTDAQWRQENAVRSSYAVPRCSKAIGAIRRPPPPPSPAVGSIPETLDDATPTAISTLSIDSRT